MLRKIKDRVVKFLEEASTIELTLYQLGNFVWKEYTFKEDDEPI